MSINSLIKRRGSTQQTELPQGSTLELIKLKKSQLLKNRLTKNLSLISQLLKWVQRGTGAEQPERKLCISSFFNKP